MKLSIIESLNSKLFLNSATMVRLRITEANVTIEIVLIPESHLNPEFINHPEPNENKRKINQIVKWWFEFSNSFALNKLEINSRKARKIGNNKYMFLIGFTIYLLALL